MTFTLRDNVVYAKFQFKLFLLPMFHSNNLPLMASFTNILLACHKHASLFVRGFIDKDKKIFITSDFDCDRHFRGFLLHPGVNVIKLFSFVTDEEAE